MGIRVGLDIGIASVGWCVIDPSAEQILGLGVRTFKKAEDPKTGDSLARPRRLARSLRRRLRRRGNRMLALRKLFVSRGVIPEDLLASVYLVHPHSKTPYQLRAEGLDRCLTNEEWVRVLTQLCKRRGFKSMRLSEKPDDDEGVVKEAIAANRVAMQEKGYRTAGEMLWMDVRFAESKRNRGDYKGVISRELVLDEITALFEAQRRHGSAHAGADLEAAYLDVLTSQAPITEGEELKAKVGRCSLDGTNRRIPSACYSFERFRILDKLHNVRYGLPPTFASQELTSAQRQAIVEKAFSRQTVVTYADVRKICGLPDDARFVGVRYRESSVGELDAEKKEKLPHPKAWHEMRKRVTDASPDDWEALATDGALLDAVGETLTYYKLDESVRRELAALGLLPPVVEALLPCRFSGHGHLSRQTILAILPHLEAGLSYVDACEAAGLHHSVRPAGERHAKLPPIPGEELRNPVVLRALSQTRKVLNAIIDTWGPIEELHVEMARDVGRSVEDRRAIERRQKENYDRNEAVLAQLKEDFGISSPRPLDIVKFRLWKDQDGRCAYSGIYIDPVRMLSGEAGVAEVDHILPHSRSFDDGYLNKVLVTYSENQKKQQRTPFEYFGHDVERWHEFEERVHTWPVPSAKKERLLRRSFDQRAMEEYRERNLVDTRYIARFFKNFAEAQLRFAGESKAPVLTVNGRATAYLRTAWRLQKTRAEGDLHHALDAGVLAATSRSMVQGVSTFFAQRPLRSVDGQYVDQTTGELIDARHVPEPWEGFADELTRMIEARFSGDPLAALNDPDLSPHPILVSRMPSRTVRGEAHKETVKRVEGEDGRGRTVTSKRVHLQALTSADLERMVGKERDLDLYRVLRERLDAHTGDAAKAFADPVYKPSRPGGDAPRVRAIRVREDPMSGGVEVRGGMADCGSMVRTDVFEKAGGYYLVPVYVNDAAAGQLPRLACVSGKGEKDWRVVDETYRFRFSLYLNDLVRLEKQDEAAGKFLFGYYKGMNRSTASITIEAHDSSWVRSSLGVARGVVAFDKLVTDVLGRCVSVVGDERRCGFPNRQSR